MGITGGGAPIASATCAVLCAAEQRNAVQAVNAMPCKFRCPAGRTGNMGKYK